MLMPLFTAALVVRRRYLLDNGAQPFVARGAARCASQVLGRGAQADARGATHVPDRGVQLPWGMRPSHCTLRFQGCGIHYHFYAD